MKRHRLENDDAPFIDTESHADKIRQIVECYAPAELHLQFAPDIPGWCVQHGKPHHTSPFALAKAFSDGDTWLIVFKRFISKRNLDEQRYKGVEHAEKELKANPMVFLLHLTLHETYHLVHDDSNDKKANVWALNEGRNFIRSGILCYWRGSANGLTSPEQDG